MEGEGWEKSHDGGHRGMIAWRVGGQMGRTPNVLKRTKAKYSIPAHP